MIAPPVIVIALDAVDSTLAREWTSAGLLPTLERLLAESARAEVRTPVGIVGAIWMNFSTCHTVARHGFHCWEEIDPASYQRRAVTPSWSACAAFWDRLSDAGCRLAVVDIPHTRVERAANGVVIAEWGSHDRHFGFHCFPPELTAKIATEIGFHPVLGVEPFAVRDFSPDDDHHRSGKLRTLREERQLFEDLIQGVRMKKELLCSLMAQGNWDLFLAMFCEAHAAGHQLWHLHDPDHVRYDPATVEALGGDPVLRIYRETDAALGELLKLAPEDATILVLMSHGMGTHYNGVHLLEEVLGRLDRFNRGETSHRPIVDLIRNRIRPAVPWLQRLASSLGLPPRLRRSLGGAVAIRWDALPEVRARQRYFLAPNNYLAGGIRLNVKGREAQGCVEPGDIERVCDQLEADLLAVINVVTGRPLIRSIKRTDLHHRRPAGDTLPDLLVEWNRSGPAETVSSPKIGSFRIPDPLSRSGDHKLDGLLLASGPGFARGETMPPILIEDIGPSIAARLGTRLDDVEGQEIGWLAGRA